MEKKYWLTRERSSVGMAKAATSSRARLIHYQLAGLCSVKAAKAVALPSLAGGVTTWAGSTRPQQPLHGTASDAFYYSCLEQGAKYLAEQAADPAERAEHLRIGATYAARAEEAALISHPGMVH